MVRGASQALFRNLLTTHGPAWVTMGMYVMSPRPLGWIPDIGFHVRLREVRRQHAERHGTKTISQAEFARLCGLPVAAYKQWEAGNNRPADIEAVARRIAQVTGVSADWLIGPDSGPDGGGASIVPIATKKGPDMAKAQFIYTGRTAA